MTPIDRAHLNMDLRIYPSISAESCFVHNLHSLHRHFIKVRAGSVKGRPSCEANAQFGETSQVGIPRSHVGGLINPAGLAEQLKSGLRISPALVGRMNGDGYVAVPLDVGGVFCHGRSDDL